MTVAIGTIFIMLASAIGLAIISYLLSTEEVIGVGTRIVGGVIKRIPMQSVKIIITTWQILTQVSANTGNRLASPKRGKGKRPFSVLIFQGS